MVTWNSDMLRIIALADMIAMFATVQPFVERSLKDFIAELSTSMVWTFLCCLCYFGGES